MDGKANQRVERQRQIWEYQFGPSEAQRMIEEATSLLEEDRSLDLQEAFARVEPEGEVDTDIVPRHA
jgi:hypothetical protein